LPVAPQRRKTNPSLAVSGWPNHEGDHDESSDTRRHRFSRDVVARFGPIVDEQALISVLTNRHIAGAAIDVFDIEPLPPSHPFRTLDNVLATPHIGYVSDGLYKTFYEDTVSNIRQWLDTR
jgi:hypothetical protein